MASRSNKPSITSLVLFALIVSPLAYVLSYAPVVRICEGSDEALTTGAIGYPVYEPVDWLIDNTPLREPIFSWGGLWNVRAQFELAHAVRVIWDSEPTEAVAPVTIIHAE